VSRSLQYPTNTVDEASGELVDYADVDDPYPSSEVLENVESEWELGRPAWQPLDTEFPVEDYLRADFSSMTISFDESDVHRALIDQSHLWKSKDFNSNPMVANMKKTKPTLGVFHIASVVTTKLIPLINSVVATVVKAEFREGILSEDIRSFAKGNTEQRELSLKRLSAAAAWMVGQQVQHAAMFNLAALLRPLPRATAVSVEHPEFVFQNPDSSSRSTYYFHMETPLSLTRGGSLSARLFSLEQLFTVAASTDTKAITLDYSEGECTTRVHSTHLLHSRPQWDGSKWSAQYGTNSSAQSTSESLFPVAPVDLPVVPDDPVVMDDVETVTSVPVIPVGTGTVVTNTSAALNDNVVVTKEIFTLTTLSKSEVLRFQAQFNNFRHLRKPEEFLQYIASDVKQAIRSQLTGLLSSRLYPDNASWHWESLVLQGEVEPAHLIFLLVRSFEKGRTHAPMTHDWPGRASGLHLVVGNVADNKGWSDFQTPPRNW
jgi:hypothetical protein